ncbi:GspE/PulE family protein [Caldimonas tepidiphila]|uniref:GspE/PulE family protein n=1 Tax=Caldimonas tepidiphila TaxID=2315841 RepID=UPI003AF391A8
MIADACGESARSGTPALELLQARLRLPRDEFTAALGRTLHYPVLTRAALAAHAPAFDALPFPQALRQRCIPLRLQGGGGLALVIGDPFATERIAWLEEQVPEPFAWFLAHPDDVGAFLARHEDSARAMDSVRVGTDAAEREDAGAVEFLSIQSIGGDASPVVKLVNSTLYDALQAGASDVHLETTPGRLLIKYRIDGVLVQVASPAGQDLAEQAISRIKVMAELDIGERRVPQDGRFRISIRGRAVDFRVSVMPSIHGEDAVLRLLDKQALADRVRGLSLESLGFDEPTKAAIRRLSREPHGMVLVTGPTGSGKTTTLYAVIGEINSGQDKIITIEDPVEYQLPGVLQIPVNEKKGLTFARGLRSVLRHDPDKIMVGEIRDPETAQIAVQAALTGHLVFTTVHANNAFDVIGRLTHMGLDPYNFVSATNGILAQRLVRRLCPRCAVEERPDAALLRDSGLREDALEGFRFLAARGCGHCRMSGYKGRQAISELLVFDDGIRELIVRRETTPVIRQAALRAGTRPLRHAALDLVRRGETTLQEINRVTLVA